MHMLTQWQNSFLFTTIKDATSHSHACKSKHKYLTSKHKYNQKKSFCRTPAKWLIYSNIPYNQSFINTCGCVHWYFNFKKGFFFRTKTYFGSGYRKWNRASCSFCLGLFYFEKKISLWVAHSYVLINIQQNSFNTLIYTKLRKRLKTHTFYVRCDGTR